MAKTAQVAQVLDGEKGELTFNYNPGSPRFSIAGNIKTNSKTARARNSQRNNFEVIKRYRDSITFVGVEVSSGYRNLCPYCARGRRQANYRCGQSRCCRYGYHQQGQDESQRQNTNDFIMSHLAVPLFILSIQSNAGLL